MASKRATLLLAPEIRNFAPLKEYEEYFLPDSLDETILPKVGSNYSRFMSVPFIYSSNLDENSTKKAISSLGERIANSGLQCEIDYSLDDWRMYLGKESFNTIVGTPGVIALVHSHFHKQDALEEKICLTMPDGFQKKITLPKQKPFLVAEVGISPLPLGTRPYFLMMASLSTGREILGERIKDIFIDFSKQHEFLDNPDYKEYISEYGRDWSVFDIRKQ